MAAWSDDGRLTAVGRDLVGLPAWVAAHGMCKADSVLLALADRASSDDVAARALLQVLLPGVRGLAAAVRWMEAEDAAHAALDAVWERIRFYPVGRRPTMVATNILLDARQRLVRSRHRDACPWQSTLYLGLWNSAELESCQDFDRSVDCQASPGEELVALLIEAVQSQRLSTDEASMIGRFRIEDVSPRDERGLPQTASKRRYRAERRLAAAV